MSDEQSEDWTVPCSDDEAYQDSPPATEGKKRVYEPSGAQIAMLYRQLEKSGAIDLKWQCPGRRSPSVHSNSQVNEKKQSESGDNSKKIEPNEFDFDDEMFDEPSASKIAVPRRKSTSQVAPKKVAKLDKIMNDIKKYQIVDQQTRKLSTD